MVQMGGSIFNCSVQLEFVHTQRCFDNYLLRSLCERNPGTWVRVPDLLFPVPPQCYLDIREAWDLSQFGLL